MPKLDFNISSRMRLNPDKLPCELPGCDRMTLDIEQNHCAACNALVCFVCVAIKRTYCCDAWVKRFYAGLMRPECEAVNAAIQAGNRKALKRALADFGVGSTDEKIAREISFHNAASNQRQAGCRECHSKYANDGELCASCNYWHKLAAEYGVTVQIIRILFKEWNPREYNTFREYMATFGSILNAPNVA